MAKKKSPNDLLKSISKDDDKSTALGKGLKQLNSKTKKKSSQRKVSAGGVSTKKVYVSTPSIPRQKKPKELTEKQKQRIAEQKKINKNYWELRTQREQQFYRLKTKGFFEGVELSEVLPEVKKPTKANVVELVDLNWDVEQNYWNFYRHREKQFNELKEQGKAGNLKFEDVISKPPKHRTESSVLRIVNANVEKRVAKKLKDEQTISPYKKYIDNENVGVEKLYDAIRYRIDSYRDKAKELGYKYKPELPKYPEDKNISERSVVTLLNYEERMKKGLKKQIEKKDKEPKTKEQKELEKKIRKIDREFDRKIKKAAEQPKKKEKTKYDIEKDIKEANKEIKAQLKEIIPEKTKEKESKIDLIDEEKPKEKSALVPKETPEEKAEEIAENFYDQSDKEKGTGEYPQEADEIIVNAVEDMDGDYDFSDLFIKDSRNSESSPSTDQVDEFFYDADGLVAELDEQQARLDEWDIKTEWSGSLQRIKAREVTAAKDIFKQAIEERGKLAVARAVFEHSSEITEIISEIMYRGSGTDFIQGRDAVNNDLVKLASILREYTLSFDEVRELADRMESQEFQDLVDETLG